MRRLSLFFATLPLFVGISFGQQDNKTKTQAPPKNATLQPKSSKDGMKRDTINHTKKLPPPNKDAQ